MKITILGSGTSTGVPVLGCDCPVCHSEDNHDKRTRSSILIENNQENNQTKRKILIDTGPDLRLQLFRENISSIDAVLYTHFHYDHLGGLDDLRPISKKRKKPLECYANFQTMRDIARRYPYLKFYKKYKNLPRLDMKLYRIKGTDENDNRYRDFILHDFHIQPIHMTHVPVANIYSTGFVINSRLAYLTDFVSIHPPDEEFLYGLNTMIIGAPFWEKNYPSHMKIIDAIKLVEKFKPQHTFITHLSHEYSHRELESMLPESIYPSYDGMKIDIKH